MCYDVVSATKAKIKYAKHRGEDPEYIRELEMKLERLMTAHHPGYHLSGFSHPQLLVFSDEYPNEPQLMQWGLIPSWVRDEKQANEINKTTLNARGETIFEKPSFRNSAKNKRCLVYIDGFYEHHHYKGKTFPFHISMKNDEPMALAGLWNDWTNKQTGEIIKTVSIVTTHANKLMSKIHNNPKLEGPRMPVILPKEFQDAWLNPLVNEKECEQLKELLIPFDENELKAHTVSRLKGKDATGNKPEALKEFVYAELEFS